MASTRVGLDGDGATNFDGESRPPTQGLFVQPTKKWDATNLMFIHDVGSKELKEFPKILGHTDRNRFQVPADSTADFVDFAYGPMPEALTARPIVASGCCPSREIAIARHMFGEPVAKVEVKGLGCAWNAGCAAADVIVQPLGNTGGVSYTGTLKRNMLPECCGNETTLEWSTPNKPYMKLRALSTLDTCKYQFCQDVWFGWRGSSTAVPQTQALYDASRIMRICDECDLCLRQCGQCKNNCCARNDWAPRFARSEDIRRVVRDRYDYEFSCRNIAGEETVELSQAEDAEEASVLRPLPRAHLVDALYTSRLYVDVVCGKPNVAWSNDHDATHEREAAVDVRYRGSRRHAVVGEDDHLIVLGGLIMQTLFMFPGVNGAPVWGGPAWLNKGRLLPREHTGASAPSNAV